MYSLKLEKEINWKDADEIKHLLKFFVNKFSNVPEEKWCIGLRHNHEGQMCALGMTEESISEQLSPTLPKYTFCRETYETAVLSELARTIATKTDACKDIESLLSYTYYETELGGKCIIAAINNGRDFCMTQKDRDIIKERFGSTPKERIVNFLQYGLSDLNALVS